MEQRIEKQECGGEQSAVNLALFESVGSVTVARMSLGVHIVAHLNWQVKAVIGDLPPTKFPRALPTGVVTGVATQPNEAREGARVGCASLNRLEGPSGVEERSSGGQKFAQ